MSDIPQHFKLCQGGARYVVALTESVLLEYSDGSGQHYNAGLYPMRNKASAFTLAKDLNRLSLDTEIASVYNLITLQLEKET